jgi:hypothetical protein
MYHISNCDILLFCMHCSNYLLGSFLKQNTTHILSTHPIIHTHMGCLVLLGGTCVSIEKESGWSMWGGMLSNVEICHSDMYHISNYMHQRDITCWAMTDFGMGFGQLSLLSGTCVSIKVVPCWAMWKCIIGCIHYSHMPYMLCCWFI